MTMTPKAETNTNSRNSLNNYPNSVKTIIDYISQKHTIFEKKVGKTFSGKQILGITPFCSFGTIKNTPTNPSSKDFYATIPKAHFCKEENKIQLKVISNTCNKSQANALVYYDYNIDTNGFPKIDIYVLFGKTSDAINKNQERHFDITFNRTCTTGIDLCTIKTIEVFLIQDDPRTSRGTVTTVTPPMRPD